MSDQQDSQLQALFANAQHDLGDDEFTAKVLLATRRQTMRRYGYGVLAGALTLLVASQFMAPLQTVALLIANLMSIELIELGESAAAWFLTPVNNLATLLLVLGKGLRTSWKKARHASFAS